MGTEAYIIIVETALLAGLVPAFIATSKGRRFLPWWFYGAGALIVALPHALLVRAPADAADHDGARSDDRQECPACGENLPAHAIACRYCGASLTSLAGATQRQNGKRANGKSEKEHAADDHPHVAMAHAGASSAAAAARFPGARSASSGPATGGASGDDLPWSDADFARLSGLRSNGAERPRFAPAPVERGPRSRETVGIAAVAALMIIGIAFLGYRVLIPDEPGQVAGRMDSAMPEPRGPASSQTNPVLPPDVPGDRMIDVPSRLAAEPVPSAPGQRAVPGDPEPETIAAEEMLPRRPIIPSEVPVVPEIPSPEAADNSADPGVPSSDAGIPREATSQTAARTERGSPPSRRPASSEPAATGGQDGGGGAEVQGRAAPGPKAPVPRATSRPVAPAAAPAQPWSGNDSARGKETAPVVKREAAPDPESSVTAVGELVTWLQERLAALGYYKGPVNGRAGPETRKAIMAYQRARQLTPTGHINEALIVSLRRTTRGTAQSPGQR